MSYRHTSSPAASNNRFNALKWRRPHIIRVTPASWALTWSNIYCSNIAYDLASALLKVVLRSLNTLLLSFLHRHSDVDATDFKFFCKDVAQARTFESALLRY